jgi:hypothetical protein
MSTKKHIHNSNNRLFETSLIATLSFILFPYVLAVFIMNFMNVANSVLIDVSSLFSLAIGIITLTCSVVCLKAHKNSKKPLLVKIVSIVNIVLSSIMCLTGIVEVIYCFNLVFPYVIVLIDILLIAYVPIAIIVLISFITILLLEISTKASTSKRSV